MWIVALALRRPFTIAVMSILIFVMGLLSLSRMPVDVFPTIDIPAVSVVWSYPGLSPLEMERRVVFPHERTLSTTVNGVASVQSQSIAGLGVMRVFFQPDVDLATAIAQINATSNTAMRNMPPGIQPPMVIEYNAASVPVAQLTLQSDTLTEQEIQDEAMNTIRLRLFTIPGLSSPAPFGGKEKQITVDLDPKALASKGLSPMDAINALQNSNLILPAGYARMGSRQVSIQTNSNPELVPQLGEIPIKAAGGAVVLLRDVAKVYLGFADQTNIVRINSKRAVYMAILKHANSSTLAVVDGARSILPLIKQGLPDGLDMQIDFDQSRFVKSAIKSVIMEAVIASILVSLLILFFMGSWRSMVVVCTSIPLAIFAGLIGLKLFGHTINIMTLGGLSLAVGMLVDDAAVEVENVHRNRLLGKPLTVAILDGAQQIAVPAIVSTLAICIVFFPIVLLEGPARFLFAPLALGVVISMMASYVLSRTLVPAMIRMLMAKEEGGEGTKLLDRMMARFNPWREKYFTRLQNAYGSMLESVLSHRKRVMLFSIAALLLSLSLIFVVGRDFFPAVDAGMMKLQIRAPEGARIEETEKLVERLEKRIRDIIPESELQTVNAMIGIPPKFTIAFVPTDNVGDMDGEMLISLKPGHQPVKYYMTKIREVLAKEFPGASGYFKSADIMNQVLNFGLSAPMNIQVEGPDLNVSHGLAKELCGRLEKIPGLADVRIKQSLDYPTMQINVDRQKAARMGLSQKDVAQGLLVSLSANTGIAPSYFLNPKGVSMNVVAKVPQEQLNSTQALASLPITPPTPLLAHDSPRNPVAQPQAPAQIIGNLATFKTMTSPSEVGHQTIQRIVDVMANVEGRDLGSVSNEVIRVMKDFEKEIKVPKGTRLLLRGQHEIMQTAFTNLGLGMILAALLVYLIMVVLFQSWLDPFIIMTAVPGALAGVLWALSITGTTINVTSLMGATMAIGIAVANAILLVSFANDVRVEKGLDPIQAALEAGITRLRPVLITALAMCLGMLPMALGLGEAGEQNAPLGIAVIGGLGMATLVTLFVVPVVYSLLRTKLPTKHLLESRFSEEKKGSIYEQA